MKKFVSYILASIMAASSVIGVYASSTNTAGNLLEVKEDAVLCENGSPKTLTIQPRNGVESGDSIILTVENGEFNRNLVEDDTIRLSYLISDGIDADGLTDGQDNPFLFRAERGGETYRYIMANQFSELYDTLRYYVGNRNSRKLPYGYRWINSKELEVRLCPISDNYVNQNNSDITKGTPIYDIALPIVSGDTLGDIKVTVDSNGSSISGGSYTVARVVEDDYDFDAPVTDYEYNSNIYVDRNLDIESGQPIKYNGKPQSLIIKPTLGVDNGDSIMITIKNGSFEESMLEECKFTAERGGETYEYIMANRYADDYDTLKIYVGDRNSRQLPYGLEYVSENMLKVNLYPIPDNYVNQNNSDITKGIPIYKIMLPAIAGSKTAPTEVAVDGRKSSITSGGWYTIANGIYNDDQSYTKNNNIFAEREVSLGANEPVLYNGEPIAVFVKPTSGVEEGDSILIKVQNGSFDESLLDNCKFTAERGGETYEQIMANQFSELYDALRYYVGSRNSRRLPYGLEYVSSDTIRVNLFPIPDNYVNQNNSDITRGTPVYAIKLPLVSGETGYTKIAVDGQQSTIKSGGWYTVARVNTGADFSEPLDSSMKISVSKNTSVKTNRVMSSTGSPITLNITPLVGISDGESILIHINNASFNRHLVEDEIIKLSDLTSEGIDTYGFTDDEVNPFLFQAERGGETYDYIVAHRYDSDYDTLRNYVGVRNSRQLPYGLEYVSSDTVKVNLFPIPDSYVNQNNSDITQGTPIYSITLPAVTSGSTGEVTIDLDGGSSGIPSFGNYAIANVYDGASGTDTYVLSSDITASSGHTIMVPDIAIKENENDVFKAGQVSITAPEGYEFDRNRMFIIEAGVNAAFNDVYISSAGYSADNKTAIFNITNDMLNGMDRSKCCSIVVSNLDVYTSDDNNFGDINLTVSGAEAGVTEQTFKVAERKPYGFELTALEEAPVMEPGKTYTEGTDDISNFRAASFRLSENTPDSWLTTRKMEFTVPEGVHIIGADIIKTVYAFNLPAIYNKMYISDDGRKLIINAVGKDVINDNKITKIDFELYLTADADYSGDASISFTHEGYTAGPVVIADFVSNNEPVIGDVSGDGEVTSLDASQALLYASGLIELSGEAFAAADINGDGFVTSYDASNILLKASGLK